MYDANGYHGYPDQVCQTLSEMKGSVVVIMEAVNSGRAFAVVAELNCKICTALKTLGYLYAIKGRRSNLVVGRAAFAADFS